MSNYAITTPRFFSVEYDFDIDGGAVGNIETGLIMPGGKLLWLFYIQNITTCVGGGATINFGIATNLTLYGQYPAASFGANTSALQVVTTIESEVIISIAGAPLTAGKIQAGWVLAVNVGR